MSTTRKVAIGLGIAGGALLAAWLEPPQRWVFSAPVWVSLAWGALINYGAAQVIWFALARALPPSVSAMSVMAVPLIR